MEGRRDIADTLRPVDIGQDPLLAASVLVVAGAS
jgi:hypothetical protein